MLRVALVRQAVVTWIREHRAALVRTLLHLLTLAVFAAMYWALSRWIPASTPLADLESSIQLLGQILALVVGVLLIGTTVSLSSYDGADSIASLQAELATSAEPFYAKFFAGGRTRHKLQSQAFRKLILRMARVDKLLFKPYNSEAGDDGWFIYRPYWDGVWYQIANSPFYSTSRPAAELAQIQYLHEATICANTVLKAVDRLRASGACLIEPPRGTNGSNWFLEAFGKHKSINELKLAPEVSLSNAASAITLALSSAHYVQEELREHSGNADWAPFFLTTFQLEYLDYTRSLTLLIEKLQLLRWANVSRRFPLQETARQEALVDLFWLKGLVDIRQSIGALRTKVTTAHGAAKYFHQVKMWSVPGIGVSLVVLIGVLSGWPYLKWAADQTTRIEGFVVLYAAAIAAMTESSVFLIRLLWRRRSSA